MGVQLMHGYVVAANVAVTFNPKVSPAGGDRSAAPMPFGDGFNLTTDAATLRQSLEMNLRAQGIKLVGLSFSNDTAIFQVESIRYQLAAQLIGRTARIASADLPAHFKTFVLEPTVNGMPTTRVTLKRDTLVALQYDPNQTAFGLEAAEFAPAPIEADLSLSDANLFKISFSPYISLSLFDPESPLRGDVGLQSNLGYAISPNLSISGTVRLKVAGNAGSSDRVSDSVLPHVRSDAVAYAQKGRAVWKT